MSFLKDHWKELSHLAGLVFEIAGTWLLASRYVKVPVWQVPLVLLTAFWRGEYAKDAAIIGEKLAKERGINILQGLTFLLIGFSLRSVTAIADLFH